MRRRRRQSTGSTGAIRSLPVLGLRERVILPLGIPSKPPLWAARKQSINAVRRAIEGDGEVLLLTQRSADEDPSVNDFFEVGSVATVLESLETKNGEIKIIVESYARAIVLGLEFEEDLLVARVRVIKEPVVEGEDVEALMRSLLSTLEKYYARTKRHIPTEDQALLVNETRPGQLADLVAHYGGQKDPKNLNFTHEQLQQVLDVIEPRARLELVQGMIKDLLDVIDIEEKLEDQVKTQVQRTQREYYLSEKLKAIQKELGRGGDGSDTEELRERVKSAGMSEEAQEKALKEVDRLDQMPPMSAEAGVIRSYVDWLLALPWAESTETQIDVDAAAKMLDEDHYGLDKVKERILEYLAVLKLVDKIRGPILCFVGPPGVGKTSLGRSIARVTGRNFVRMSLGGVRDEAEIRGHRRTYIGSMPGRIMQGIRDARSRNPLFLLDEVDKMSMDFRGDPSAALLEVLDPEQNASFRDHYLDVAFDLSNVMFLTTANVLPAIPPPLRDRMEVIEIPGYTEYEKRNIARQFLIPKQIESHGLTSEQIGFTDGAVTDMITLYTREAGVRNLEREITNVCRKVARRIVATTENNAKRPSKGNGRAVRISSRGLRQLLGAPKFLPSKAEEQDSVGVATGLVYTQVGGDVISIETSLMPSDGKLKLTLTGQLGDVMQESAQTAFSYIRTRAAALGLSDFEFTNWEMHIHVPEGATPKEGPSAGITLCTAMISALTGKPVRKDVAMTGEITLRGRVLPIGGLKEKLLAAHRTGIRTIVIPGENAKDLDELPPSVRRAMSIHPVEHMDAVLEIAFRDGFHPISPDTTPAEHDTEIPVSPPVVHDSVPSSAR
ncbi:endopeptidase La [Candidatus Poribacteria bacterium]|nr:endopeptidase La [Candidatus Poribacteria bacterium]